MIARIWTGAVSRADADEYAEYMRQTGLREYRETAGNRGTWMLRREDDRFLVRRDLEVVHYDVEARHTGG